MLSPKEERNMGMLAYVIPMAISALSMSGWIAALVIYFIYREKSRFVARHALQSLAISILVLLLGLAAVVSVFTMILAPLAFVLGFVAAVVGVVLPIIGAVKASNGQTYEVPLIGPYMKSLN